MAEIKVRTRPTAPAQFLPQLWFGRTPHLIVGVHTGGVVGRVKIADVSDNLKTWEEREPNQVALRKLAGLLSQLRDVVKEAKGKACVAIYNRSVQPASLDIFTAEEDRKPLPEHVIKRFWKDPSTPQDE
jgi:hypothetical protein